MRQFLSVLLALAFFIAAFVWGAAAVARLPIHWLWLASAGLVVGVTVPAWIWIVHPHQLREKRRDQGLCVGCGYRRAPRVWPKRAR